MAENADIEVIARWLYVTSERGGRPERERAWGIPTIPEAMKEARRQQARELLASDWLAEHDARVRAEALRGAADEMVAVIADGDCAAVAAHVPGEVGRSAVIARRDTLYEEPATWLRDYADTYRIPPASTDQGGQA